MAGVVLNAPRDALQESMEQGWFVRRGTQVRGPHSSARIRHLVLEGRLHLNDEVSRDRAVWQPLGAVAEVVPLQLRRDGAVDASALLAHERRERQRAMRGTFSALTLLLLAVGTVLWFGGERPAPVAVCTAPAAPAVNWRSCRLDGLRAPSSDLTQADLSNASLVNALLNDSRLDGADLGYANLTGAGLSYAVLAGARLLGANLRGADLTHADLSGADLAYADLSGALLGGAVLTATRLDGAIWIDGRQCATPSLGACR
jgi:hypothetical protein